MFLKNLENKNFYIFTGGPGSGKTTVLNCLAERGYLTVEETGRKIIRHQSQTNGDALPWDNASRYARLMFLHSLTDFEEYAHLDQKCFFDRGIIDVLGYCRLCNISVSSALETAAKKYQYNKKVFLFPFWQEIYTTDTEKKQNITEAQNTYAVLKATYEEFGYETIVVPCLLPEERVKWILNHL